VRQELESMHNNPVTREPVCSPGDGPRSSWRFYHSQDASILRTDRIGCVRLMGCLRDRRHQKSGVYASRRFSRNASLIHTSARP
jgi:hypothetical protein